MLFSVMCVIVLYCSTLPMGINPFAVNTTTTTNNNNNADNNCNCYMHLLHVHFLWTNWRQNHDTEVDNKCFVGMEKFKQLERTLANQNCMHEEIKSRLKSGNVCWHSVQNTLSSIQSSRSKVWNIQYCLLLCIGVKLGL
jgi:hypothetical protein